MKRSELEHLLRAAGSIANDAEIVVIGSQAILGQFPNAPTPLLLARLKETDVAQELRKIIEARIRRDAAESTKRR